VGKIKLPSGQPLEFILAVPGRRYGEFVDTLADFQASAQAAEHEITGETGWKGMRLVMAHQPYQAKEQTQLRRERIAQLKERADHLAGKLDGRKRPANLSITHSFSACA
jgi:hypothetical protein